MENMNITSAQYVVSIFDSEVKNIKATIDGVEMHVPTAPGNRHYDAIMKAVEAGDLTVADAE